LDRSRRGITVPGIADFPLPPAPVWVLCCMVGAGGAVILDLIRPRGFVSIVQSLFAGVFGAVGGQVIAQVFGWTPILVGEISVVTAVLGALVSILVARRMNA